MIDRLINQILEKQNPTVVGLDPSYEMIPPAIRAKNLAEWGKTPKAVAAMFVEFNCAIMDAVHDLIPCVKPQIAMYERYGLAGLNAYFETIDYAHRKGLLVIGDIKRSDIASTAEAYSAHLAGVTIEGEFFDLWQEDAITLNPYLGSDGIVPFLKPCAERDRGIFVLVKTSNQSSGELQDKLMDGRPMYELTAELVKQWGKDLIGRHGYSKVGAVVGATYREQGLQLRKLMPETFFLVPGYGAQGGKGADLKGYFDQNGIGSIVNSSRGIIAAWKKDEKMKNDPALGAQFTDAARTAVLEMKADLQQAMAG